MTDELIQPSRNLQNRVALSKKLITAEYFRALPLVIEKAEKAITEQNMDPTTAARLAMAIVLPQLSFETIAEKDKARQQ